MKIFEIIFILLLMIPLALLMRYFIARLSLETPRERKFRSSRAEEKPTFREILHPEEYYDDLYGEDLGDLRDFEDFREFGFYEEPPAKEPVYDEPPARPEKPRKKIRKIWQRKKKDPAEQEPAPSGGPGMEQHPREPINIREKPVYTPDGGSKQKKPRTMTELKRTERIPFAQIYDAQEPSPAKAENTAFGKRHPAEPERTEERRHVSSDTVYFTPREITPREHLSVKEEDSAGKERPSAGRKKPARSEKQPSKRQLRKNRERARKRERSRKNRKKEES